MVATSHMHMVQNMHIVQNMYSVPYVSLICHAFTLNWHACRDDTTQMRTQEPGDSEAITLPKNAEGWKHL